jgi:hypothetical protein
MSLDRFKSGSPVDNEMETLSDLVDDFRSRYYQISGHLSAEAFQEKMEIALQIQQAIEVVECVKKIWDERERKGIYEQIVEVYHSECSRLADPSEREWKAFLDLYRKKLSGVLEGYFSLIVDRELGIKEESVLTQWCRDIEEVCYLRQLPGLLAFENSPKLHSHLSELAMTHVHCIRNSAVWDEMLCELSQFSGRSG